MQVERRQRHPRASAFSSPKKSARPFLLSTRSTASGGSPLRRTFASSTTGWWNGHVRAEQDSRLADPLVRLLDLRVHRHPGGLEIHVRVPQGDLDRPVDVDDVAVPHVAEDHLGLREVHGQLLDAPGQGEDRVAAVDQHRIAAGEEELDQRMDGLVVRVVAVEQRMHLHAEELGMVEEALGLLEVARHPRVRPDEPVQARDRLDHLGDVRVVRVEDDAVPDLVLVHQRRRDRPGRARRRTSTRTSRRACGSRRSRRKYAAGLSLSACFTCDSSASAASTPAPIST